MLMHQELIFDDFVSGTVYTGVQHAKMLGSGDRIGIHAVIDSANRESGFVVAIQHSADGVNWTQKNASPEISVTVTPVPMSKLGGEPNPPSQSLRYVRIAMTLSNAGASARVKLYVAVRDSGKGRFCTCECQDENEESQGCRSNARHGEDHRGAPEEVDGQARSRRTGGHAPELHELVETRPHRALAELEAHLAAQSEDVHPHERLRGALGLLEERDRAEVVAYLERVATVAAADGEATDPE